MFMENMVVEKNKEKTSNFAQIKTAKEINFSD